MELKKLNSNVATVKRNNFIGVVLHNSQESKNHLLKTCDKVRWETCELVIISGLKYEAHLFTEENNVESTPDWKEYPQNVTKSSVKLSTKITHDLKLKWTFLNGQEADGFFSSTVRLESGTQVRTHT